MDLVELLRSQARRYRCVRCGETMADCRINVLAQQGNRALVRVTCASCSDENLLQIIFQPAEGASAPAPSAELHPERAEALGRDGAPISADEVLEVHELLAGHAGGFTELLARR
jgi:ribosomal protein S27E